MYVPQDLHNQQVSHCETHLFLIQVLWERHPFSFDCSAYKALLFMEDILCNLRFFPLMVINRMKLIASQ